MERCARGLVIGASSYVGARIYRDLRPLVTDILGTCRGNRLFDELAPLEITDAASVRSLIADWRPNWIVHAAAIANQSGCAKDPQHAERVNLNAVSTVAQAADAIGAKLLFLSSEAAYGDSLYGSLKRRAEAVVRAACRDWCVLQPGMVFGQSPNTVNDRPHNRLLRAIESGQRSSFDSGAKFYPTWIGHLSEVVAAVIERDISGRTIPVVGDRATSRYEIASRILSRFGVAVSEERGRDVAPPAEISQAQLLAASLPLHTTDWVIETVGGEIAEYLSVSESVGKDRLFVRTPSPQGK